MANDPNLDFYSFSVNPTPTEPTEPTDGSPSPEPSPDPETVRAARSTASRVGWGILILCLVWVALSEIIAIVALTLKPEWQTSTVFLSLASMVPLYAVALPVSYLAMRRMPTARPERRIAVDKRLFALLPCAYALMMGGNLLGNTVMGMISAATGYSFSSSLEVSLGMPLWLSALLVVVIAPFFEELIFRKLLIDRLLPLGEFAAVVLTALLFAIFHFNLYQFFYAGLLGALLALIYLRTGSFGLCVAMHASINFLGGILPTYLMELSHYEELLAITADPAMSAEALMEFLSDNSVGIFLLFLYLLLMGLLAIVGVVLLIVFRKKLALNRRDGELAPAARNRALFLNPGMIALLSFAVLFTVLTLIASATPL